jgi:hypothetical protein
VCTSIYTHTKNIFYGSNSSVGETVGVPITHWDVPAGDIILSIAPCTEAELMDVARVLPCSLLYVDRTDNGDAGGEDVVGVAEGARRR